MNNEVKREMEKIEIPEELHERAELGIKQVKQEERKRKIYPKWMIGTAAALMIIGASFSVGGSYMVDAAETLLGKIFETEEQEQIQADIQKAAPDPELGAEEAKGSLLQMEQHLKLAKEHLSPEDFEDYSQLIKESMEINVEMLATPEADQEKLDKRLLEIQAELDKYGIYALTIHTLEEAQTMVSYPIKHPAYIPEGYQLIEEEIRTEEANAGEDPVVMLQYHQIDGEFNFYTFTEKIDHSKEDELTWYDHIDSYQLSGYTFEHAYDGGPYHNNVQGMRVTIPEKGYEILMHASLLSKEEMEKVLLSMVE
ncbi:hypothetical protein [Gracilibacillus xinjiangensis]|uniref:DUF4367 domain-containing protein n=1 Tax=Gracilibacillus xinjiangensis TaxID=1193282 RepID=A0ABV8WSU6_9BACI